MHYNMLGTIMQEMARLSAGPPCHFSGIGIASKDLLIFGRACA